MRWGWGMWVEGRDLKIKTKAWREGGGDEVLERKGKKEEKKRR